MISIVIPTYNMARQLKHCLAALALQSLVPDEVVIVDDGSTDNTADEIQSYPISKFGKLTMVTQNHAGASAARNSGFARSTGDLVMFLDADVALKKHALERLNEVLAKGRAAEQESGGIGYAYSSFRWGWKKFTSYPFDAKRLKQMPFIHTTSLIRRVALPEKPFDVSLKRLQDWDLYLSLLERGYGGAFVREILFTVEPKGSMSKWLPSVMYQIPFEKLGIRIEQMEKYREVEQIVRIKHGL